MNATIPYVQNVMGTAVTFHSRTGLPALVIDEAMAHLDWVDNTFSTFKATSDVSLISDGILALEDAHEDVHRVMLRCAQLEDATRGAFDYHDGARIDPAGFVKGWAIDGAADILREAGVSDFLIWAGGDVAAQCPAASRRPWTIGVRDPEDPSNAIDSVALTSGAIATSGTYERGEHIRRVESGLASVTVTGPSLGTSDALATAVFSAGLERAAQWLPAFPTYDVIAVTEDRTVVRTRPRKAA